ncbi:uncharacterized protein LOC143030237 [Oratosquilla oratoria]|uniref:uncharacterized protein LOC143030237 n=1 Tax=Oratosquilla oratoria TaxID=337810 RepID=UPI003F762D77
MDNISDFPVSIFYGRLIEKAHARNPEQVQVIDLGHVDSDDDTEEEVEHALIMHPLVPAFTSCIDTSMFDHTSERATFDASADLSLDGEDDTVFLEITAPREKNVEAPQAQARKARANTRATTTSWVPADENDVTTDHNYLGPESIFNDDLRQPIEYVRQFLTDDLLETFVTQSNLYSVQRNPNKPLNTNKNELEQWLGLCIYFSISKLPNIRMHWSHHLGAMKDMAADVMSRNRWESIKSNFHMVVVVVVVVP